MQQLEFTPAAQPRRVDPGQVPPLDGFAWLDALSADTWQPLVTELTQGVIDERHLSDARNPDHPPFFDGTERYDMLIVRAPVNATESNTAIPTTEPVVFFLFERLLISLHGANTSNFGTLIERALSGRRRAPEHATGLLLLLLGRDIDRVLRLAEPISRQIDSWQGRMMSTGELFTEWQELQTMRGRLNSLILEQQSALEALSEWREELPVALGERDLIHFNDLTEHLTRGRDQFKQLRNEIDSSVQIYYSAASQRTNQIMQFLAVVSAIFLPLNLLVGFFGMNFHNLPLVEQKWAVWLIITILASTPVYAIWWFKRRGWL